MESVKPFKKQGTAFWPFLLLLSLFITIGGLAIHWLREGKLAHTPLVCVEREKLSKYSSQVNTACAVLASKKGYAVVMDKKIAVAGIPDVTEKVLALIQTGKNLTPPSKPPAASEIGIVDQDFLFNIPSMQNARSNYQKFFSSLTKAYEKTAAKLSSAKQQELKMKYNADLAAYRKKEVEPLFAALEHAIKSVAMERKLSLILNRSNLFYGGTDITEEVVRRASLSQTPNVSQVQPGQTMGIVNISSLLALHTSFYRVGELEREIDDWKKGSYGIAETLLSKEDLTLWEKDQRQAQEIWGKEVEKLTSAQNAMKPSQSSKELGPEAKELALIQSALNQAYEQEIEKKMESLNQDYAHQVQNVEKQIQGALEPYASQLLQFRNEQLAFQKYKLLSQLHDDLKRRSSSYQEAYLEFEKDLMERDRTKKLDLQLKLVVAPAEKKDDISAKLTQLENQEKKEKLAKQNQFKDELAQIRDTGLKQVSEKLKKIAVQLDEEAAEKIKKKRADLFLASQKTLQEEQKNIQSELAEFKKEALSSAKEKVKKRFKDSKALDLQALALSHEEALKSQLEKSKVQIESRLQEEEKQILAHSKAYLDAISVIKNGNTQLVAEIIANLEKEKSAILVSIRHDIVKQAELLAKQDGLKTVLTDVALNVSAHDLTQEIAKRLHTAKF